MEEKEKYYPFKDTSKGYLGDYYTYDETIYLKAIKLKKRDTLGVLFAVIGVLCILSMIVFSVLNNILMVGISSGLMVIGLVFSVIIEIQTATQWDRLIDTFENIPEVQEQYELEKQKLDQEELEKTTTIAKNVVEIYNIVDNKKLKKSTKIQKISKYIKEIKENK